MRPYANAKLQTRPQMKYWHTQQLGTISEARYV